MGHQKVVLVDTNELARFQVVNLTLIFFRFVEPYTNSCIKTTKESPTISFHSLSRTFKLVYLIFSDIYKILRNHIITTQVSFAVYSNGMRTPSSFCFVKICLTRTVLFQKESSHVLPKDPLATINDDDYL